MFDVEVCDDSVLLKVHHSKHCLGLARAELPLNRQEVVRAGTPVRSLLRARDKETPLSFHELSELVAPLANSRLELFHQCGIRDNISVLHACRDFWHYNSDFVLRFHRE